MHTERNEKDELQHIDNGSILAKDARAMLLGHSVSDQQGILGHLSDFDETYCVCSTYGAHHLHQLLTTHIT